MSRPARWLVLRVRIPSDELVPELSEGLLALGGSAVEEGIELLTTYVPEPDDPERFVSAAARRLGALAGAELEIAWSARDDEDWARRWRRGLEPRRVGERLVVTPPWAQPDLRPDDVPLVIEPGMAFGTGEHGTTRGVLRLLEPEVWPGLRVLDVGTGSGILAIAAAKLGAAEVVAVEADDDALENFAANVERNGVGDRILLVHAHVDEALLHELAPPPFELVLANVLSGVIVPLLPSLRNVAPGGAIVVGGMLAGEAAAVRAAAARAGLRVEREDRDDGWWSALLR